MVLAGTPAGEIRRPACRMGRGCPCGRWKVGPSVGHVAAGRRPLGSAEFGTQRLSCLPTLDLWMQGGCTTKANLLYRCLFAVQLSVLLFLTGKGVTTSMRRDLGGSVRFYLIAPLLLSVLGVAPSWILDLKKEFSGAPFSFIYCFKDSKIQVSWLLRCMLALSKASYCSSTETHQSGSPELDLRDD